MNKGQSDEVALATQNWVERVVIDLNLCPFAKREWLSDKVRVHVATANDAESLVHALVVELALLNRNSEIETTLLVHPDAMSDFDEFNQFLAFADAVIEQMQLQGEFQVASFHPDYRFEGTEYDDAENFTNRSPFPMLHILREASLERVIEAHADTQSIPVRNINLLRELGLNHMRTLLDDCK